MSIEMIKMARLNVGEQKGFQHHLGGFLGYVAQSNKE